MKMTPERMAEIEAAEAAATGGPWEVEGLYPVCAPEVRDDEDQAAIVAHTDGNSWLGSDEAEKNAAFIAMSRTAIPELLAAIEELEGEAAVMDKHLALAAREIMDRNGKIDALRERINMTMPDMGKRDAEIVARAETAEADLAEVRRQERKVCMALVNMSGKVSGDGAREMLASIKLAEEELAKEDALAEADSGKAGE